MRLLGFNEKSRLGGVWEQGDEGKYFDMREGKNTYIILKLLNYVMSTAANVGNRIKTLFLLWTSLNGT